MSRQNVAKPLKIVLPYPPSTNHYWRHITRGALAGRTLISSEGRVYRTNVLAAVLEQRAKKGIGTPIAVDVLAFVPDRRRRDLDNLTKSLLDSITHAGVWLDDSQIDDLHVRRARDADGALILGGRVEITIRAI